MLIVVILLNLVFSTIIALDSNAFPSNFCEVYLLKSNETQHELCIFKNIHSTLANIVNLGENDTFKYVISEKLTQILKQLVKCLSKPDKHHILKLGYLKWKDSYSLVLSRFNHKLEEIIFADKQDLYSVRHINHDDGNLVYEKTHLIKVGNIKDIIDLKVIIPQWTRDEEGFITIDLQNDIKMRLQKLAHNILSEDFETDILSKSYFKSKESLIHSANVEFNGILSSEKSVICYYDRDARYLNAIFQENAHLYTVLPVAEDKMKTNNDMVPHIMLVVRELSKDFNDLSHDDINIPEKRMSLKLAREALTDNYTIEAVFYITPGYLDLPYEYLPYIAAKVDQYLSDPSIKTIIRFRLTKISNYENRLVFANSSGSMLINLKQFKIIHDPYVDVAILISNMISDRANNGEFNAAKATNGGMCDFIDSVVIAHDSLLDTAVTITHEIGHLFGANHDVKFPECKHYTSSGIMGSSFNPIRHNVWSQCSVKAIHKTLKSGIGNCLLNLTSERGINNTILPDEINRYLCQTRSKNFKVSFQKSTCESLKCHNRTHHVSSNVASTDGTFCHRNSRLSSKKSRRICYKGKCISDIKPVQWITWNPWSNCTGYCHLGVRARYRICDVAKNSRDYFCLGGNQELHTCEIDMNYYRCAKSQKIFIDKNDEMCNAFIKGSKFYPNWKYNTYLGDVAPCQLFCYKDTNNRNRRYFKSDGIVLDGTVYGQYSVCINGNLVGS
ncbi:unnamed protein product [Gordionus sp. m RMFG-2023]